MMLTLGEVADELMMFDPMIPVAIIDVTENPDMAK